jgi:hypothetical protein
MDVDRFAAIRPALDELEAARTPGLECRAVLCEAAALLLPHEDRRRLSELLGRILRHPELQLRVFLAPVELDEVIEGLVHVLCFANGAEFSLTSLVGPNWVVLNGAFAAFMDLGWFHAIFLDTQREPGWLAYPRRGERRYRVLSRQDVARLAAELPTLIDNCAAAPEARAAAEGLAQLAREVLSREALSLAHTSLR